MFEEGGILLFQHFDFTVFWTMPGDKMVDSESSDTTSEEQSRKTQYQDDRAADPGQDSDKKTGLFWNES